MFEKILVANRGEIACRVMKTARRMGISTVAVYSEADRDALHVTMANQSVLIGPAPSAQSYLLIDRIVEACLQTGAQAVHPGYGFLSENKDFRAALETNGIVFIGPGTRAIEAMGDKIASKKIAMEANVNTVPGHADVIADSDEATRIAEEIGFPVMIKASAGGGGKGMRIARDAEEVRDGFERATSEARSSFGDERVFIEKFIEEPRHIEIQVLSDGETCLYLGERECSIQRRHQKVIEEAPSPFLDAETRKAMGEQAVALAQAVDYVSAGTVEFIVDRDRNFYFLEMNTRLQVEHPVTELITGLDLVEQMIRVAAGEKLSMTQDNITLSGWAMESRIYAEDPYRNFLPSTGRLVHYRPPAEENGVRVDTGVVEGGDISMFYDPMIAKLITYGDDRAHAIQRMGEALDDFYIRGVSHNIPFLASVLARQRFLDGRLSTDFIAQEYPDGFHASDLPPDDPTIAIAVAATIQAKTAVRDARISGQMTQRPLPLVRDWVVRFDNNDHAVQTDLNDRGCVVNLEGRDVTVETDWRFGDPMFRARIDDHPVVVQVDRDGLSLKISHAGSISRARVLAPRAAALDSLMPAKVAPDMSRFLLSPMPGLLVSLAVDEGQDIKAGENLAVVEAMKMENVLKADRDGTVAKIHANPGESLAVDQIILEFH